MVLLIGCESKQTVIPKGEQKNIEKLTEAIQSFADSEDKEESYELRDDKEHESSRDQTETLLVEVLSGASIIMGQNTKAPILEITMSYTCEYCKKFKEKDEDWIVEKYVKQNLIQMKRNFLTLNANDVQATKVALCAAEQNKFTEADTQLFHTIPQAKNDILVFAKKIKVPLPQVFLYCITSTIIQGNVEKSHKKLLQNGINRVPAFHFGIREWIGLESREFIENVFNEDQNN